MASGTYRSGSWGSYRSRSTGGTSSSSSNRSTGNCAPGYKTCYSNFNNKITAFRTLCSQTTGNASYKRPSPTTLNSFANWIGKGCNVFCINPTQVSKWAPRSSNFNPNSTTSVKNTLWRKFGRSTIKAVCRDKQGNFLVACTPTCKGKPFCIPC